MISPIVGATGSGLSDRLTVYLSRAPPTPARRPAGVTATKRASGIRHDRIPRHPNDMDCEFNRIDLNDEALAIPPRVAPPPTRDRLPSSKRRDTADDDMAGLPSLAPMRATGITITSASGNRAPPPIATPLALESSAAARRVEVQ
ncbi:hypothetical protein [Burkholderia cenocepacia]|uniref:hypothetical protein n=1 Tax=Burkholderia cenocepacia TaxID=95486 RepID=UPI0012376A56|nr:hypothetical protein [Burkholderia cenocepacia]